MLWMVTRDFALEIEMGVLGTKCEGFGMIVGWGVVRVAFEVKLACSRGGGGMLPG